MSREDLAAAILLALESGPKTCREIEASIRRNSPDDDFSYAEVCSVIGHELQGQVFLRGGRYSLTPPPPPPPPPPATSGGANEIPPESDEPFFSEPGLERIRRAIGQEIAAAGEGLRTGILEIDGMEHLTETHGPFTYRLALSAPARFTPDQMLTFQATNPRTSITAVVVGVEDAGLVVACQQPLPADARLLTYSFDPSFILRALEAFILERAPAAGPVTEQFASRTLHDTPSVPGPEHSELNVEQAGAVERMASTPIHLLWGPPGTGKTKTLGVAVARWAAQGRRVLVVSTSNAAVDVLMRSVLRDVLPARVLRLGTSCDPVVGQVTLASKLAGQNVGLSATVTHAQARLRAINELLQDRCQPAGRRHELLAEYYRHEEVVREFNAQAEQAAPELRAGVLVTGCTLATMVLNTALRSETFDVVVVDEASMVSLLYAVAASLLAGEHLVIAGDPKQLPPIVQAEGRAAEAWFGRNVYDWFGVEDRDARVSLLLTQYRMTDEVGGLVGRLSYGNQLRHHRGVSGPRVDFVDVGEEWRATYWSKGDNSYFHLASVPLLHALFEQIDQGQILLLSPFRPQQSLLAALAFDFRGRDTGQVVSASTIHRSQGSEAAAVVVDLTTHTTGSPATFFRDEHSSNLFNVAISRAKDRLVIIGNQDMLKTLAERSRFWRQVLAEFGTGINVVRAEDLVAGLEQTDTLGTLEVEDARNLPAIYSHPGGAYRAAPGIASLRRSGASRKLLVLPEEGGQFDAGTAIVRTKAGCAPVFVAGGVVCVPYRGRWLVTRSPSVSRVVWRVGFSHLADEEVDPTMVRRFDCVRCRSELVIRMIPGEGWMLTCPGPDVGVCSYRRRLTERDVGLLAQLRGITCPDGHPMKGRSGNGGLFLGCENYPKCEHVRNLKDLME